MRKRAALGCTVHYADPDMAALQLAATAVWRDVVLEDPDGYTFAVGTALP